MEMTNKELAEKVAWGIEYLLHRKVFWRIDTDGDIVFVLDSVENFYDDKWCTYITRGRHFKDVLGVILNKTELLIEYYGITHV